MVLVRSLAGSIKAVGPFGYLFCDTKHQMKAAFAESIYLNFHIAAMNKASRSILADHPLTVVGRGYGPRTLRLRLYHTGAFMREQETDPVRYHSVWQNLTLTESMLIKINHFNNEYAVSKEVSFLLDGMKIYHFTLHEIQNHLVLSHGTITASERT